MGKSAHSFTAADVLDHQNKLGGVKCTCAPLSHPPSVHSKTCPMSLFAPSETKELDSKTRKRTPKPVVMTLPEREMGLILEKDKREGVIIDARFHGMALFYNADPETGILLRYICDWVVITGILPGESKPPWSGIKIIECKGDGKHAITSEAKLRFKACKSAWPWFKFEMWQRLRDGTWRRVL